MAIEQTNHAPAHRAHEKTVSPWQKWATVIGNAAVGAAELATGNISALAVAGDGLHNVGDAATYWMQFDNAIHGHNTHEGRRKQLRTLSYWAISLSSFAIGTKAGVDAVTGHEAVAGVEATIAASASVFLNGTILGSIVPKLRRNGFRLSSAERDLVKHFLSVDMSSAVAGVVGATTQNTHPTLGSLAGATAGAIGAWAFRPTKSNMSHDCLAHGAGGDSHTHDHTHHHDH